MAGDVDNGSSDNCGVSSLSIDVSSFGCTDAGDNTVTLTVTDVNGNTSTCTATVTVNGNGIEAEIVPLFPANMGGEDFSYYLEEVPGAYIRFGSREGASTSYPAHSGGFDISESILPMGAQFFYNLALVAGIELRDARHLSEETDG